MTTTYLFPSHYEDDTSDSLSSFGKSSSLDSVEEPSPHFLQLSEVCDIDALTGQTKKIRKKRCAYDKIDDEKRIQLLEAVQKNNESLKSAAKRLQINYSSAKSILHTFRKEGRILKKSPLEIGARPFSMTSLPPTAMEVSPINGSGYNIPQKFPSQGSIVVERQPTGGYSSNNGASSPMKGLTSIFANLMLETDEAGEETSILKTLMVEVQKSNEEPLIIPKLNIPSFMPQLHVSSSIENRPSIEDRLEHPLEDQPPKIPSLGEITYEQPVDQVLSHPMQVLSHPLQVLKQLDNFYMNYSNSPLSGGKGLMLGECSDSGSRKYCPGEFDSFSDMMYAFQKTNNDDTKGDTPFSSLLKFTTGMTPQDKTEPKFTRHDSTDSSVMNSMIESPWMLTDTMKKVPFLSNFAQFQRPGISLVNERNK